MSDDSVFKAAIRQFLGPIVPFLEDASISEILINGPKDIFVESKGKLVKTTAQFPDEDSLRAAVNTVEIGRAHV